MDSCQIKFRQLSSYEIKIVITSISLIGKNNKLFEIVRDMCSIVMKNIN